MSLLLSLLSAAWACGPWFPHTFLTMTAEQVWEAPVADFNREAPWLFGVDPATFRASPTTAEADAADVAALGIAPEAYRAYRDGLTSGAWADAPPPAAPAGLPAEIRLYNEGAALWHQGRDADAAAAWGRVLALPAAERRLRGPWASLMLARHAINGGEHEAARGRLAQTKQLLAEAGTDGLEIGRVLSGWEARILYLEGRYAEAAALYVARMKEGYDESVSLRIVTSDLVRVVPDGLAIAAADPALNALVTLYLAAYKDVERARDWLPRVSGGDVPAADWLALLAYQAGDAAQAEGWLARAPETGIARWTEGKLRMREGRYAEAEAALAEAEALLKAHGEWPRSGWREPAEGGIAPAQEAAGERAILAAQAGRYAEALQALLSGHHWLDAAYIAERVLTTDELIAFAEGMDGAAALPGPALGEELADWYGLAPADQRLRELLARRLAREERYNEALRWLPLEKQERLKALQAHVKRGRQWWRWRFTRASNLWEAAKIMRREGMELFGTEIDPDVYVFDGQYDGPRVAEGRLALSGALQPTPDERQRVAAANAPTKRWHYRYEAAELAAEAAGHLPDDQAPTLKLLCNAGLWLAGRDPEAADVYYKAMVNRGWNHPLGRSADLSRWFPPPESCAMDELERHKKE